MNRQSQDQAVKTSSSKTSRKERGSLQGRASHAQHFRPADVNDQGTGEAQAPRAGGSSQTNAQQQSASAAAGPDQERLNTSASASSKDSAHPAQSSAEPAARQQVTSSISIAQSSRPHGEEAPSPASSSYRRHQAPAASASPHREASSGLPAASGIGQMTGDGNNSSPAEERPASNTSRSAPQTTHPQASSIGNGHTSVSAGSRLRRSLWTNSTESEAGSKSSPPGSDFLDVTAARSTQSPQIRPDASPALQPFRDSQDIAAATRSSSSTSSPGGSHLQQQGIQGKPSIQDSATNQDAILNRGPFASSREHSGRAELAQKREVLGDRVQHRGQSLQQQQQQQQLQQQQQRQQQRLESVASDQSLAARSTGGIKPLINDAASVDRRVRARPAFMPRESSILSWACIKLCFHEHPCHHHNAQLADTCCHNLWP